MTRGTPSQTAGPYVSIGTSWNAASGLDGGVVLGGCVRDGAGALVMDALLEFWCGGAGGFARALTDDAGCYRVRIGGEVAHVDVSIFARGLMQRLVTRVYLRDDDDALEPDVRRRMIAQPESPGRYRFDIYLQGERETVFFLPWPA